MQLTERFLGFVDQQLSVVFKDADLQHLALYLSRPSSEDGPPLQLVRQWPDGEHQQLPPAELDPDLRIPTWQRRWYPLQDGALILGAVRAEVAPNDAWNAALDERLRSGAGAIGHALTLELECKQLRRELENQREHTRTLVHQLRNPLAALQTYAKLLLRRLDDESQHRDLVEGMLSEQRQLNRYISALDGLSRDALPAADPPGSPLLLPPGLAPHDLTLQDLLTPLLDRAEATASLQGRTWQGPDRWPAWTTDRSIRGDASIQEIVANLLENAFRYSPKGCAIGLELLEDGLCVWDDGPPIPILERERIFQRGVRGSTGKDRAGTGQGLALARDLAEQNGGSLELEVHPRELATGLPLDGNGFTLRWPVPDRPDRKE